MDPKLHALSRDVLGLIGALCCDEEKGTLLRVFRAASFHRIRWMAEASDRLARAHSALWVTRSQGERRVHLDEFRVLQRQYARLPSLYIHQLRQLLIVHTTRSRDVGGPWAGPDWSREWMPPRVSEPLPPRPILRRYY